MKEARRQGRTACDSVLFEISRRPKLTETESSGCLPGAGGGEEQKVTTDGYGLPSGLM